MTPDELEDKIQAWHDAPSDSHIAHLPLHEFLGWTFEKYKTWFETGEQPNG